MKYNSNMDAAKQAIEAAERRALEYVGIFIEGEAISRCPVGQYDDGRVGGNLRNSITHRVYMSGPKRVIIGATAKYAIYVEKGTGLYAEGGNGRKTPWKYKTNLKTGEMVWTRGQRPQPYLKPSVDKNLQKIKDLFRGQLHL